MVLLYGDFEIRIVPTLPLSGALHSLTDCVSLRVNIAPRRGKVAIAGEVGKRVGSPPGKAGMPKWCKAGNRHASPIRTLSDTAFSSWTSRMCPLRAGAGRPTPPTGWPRAAFCRVGAPLTAVTILIGVVLGLRCPRYRTTMNAPV